MWHGGSVRHATTSVAATSLTFFLSAAAPRYRLCDEMAAAVGHPAPEFSAKLATGTTVNMNLQPVGSLTRDGHWSCDAVDKAYELMETGTYRMLEPQLKRLCLQRKEMGLD